MNLNKTAGNLFLRKIVLTESDDSRLEDDDMITTHMVSTKKTDGSIFSTFFIVLCRSRN